MTTLWTSCITTARPDRPRSDRSVASLLPRRERLAVLTGRRLAQYHREGDALSV